MFPDPNDARRDVTRKLIKSCDPTGKVVIDLGAKFGAATDTIKCKERIKLDLDKEVKPEILCDLSEGIPLKSDSVDICAACDILEHVYHSHRFVEEIRRILKDGGYAILSVPNICSLKYRILFLFGHIPSHAAKADCTFPEAWKRGHVRDYNFNELASLLKEHGFEIIDKKTAGLSFIMKIIIPNFLLPKTFGDSVIIKARAIKNK